MSVRIIVLLCAAILAGSCASQSPVAAPAASSAKPSRAVASVLALENAGFEVKPQQGETCPAGWSCTMHADPHSFSFTPREAGAGGGVRSYCVEAVGKEPWANLTQGLRDLGTARGARVRFSAAVKLESVTGEGAGPMIIAQGRAGETIGHAQLLATGEHGWQRVEVEMDVPQATTVLQVGMTFVGRGRACLDDSRLEVLVPAGPVSGPV